MQRLGSNHVQNQITLNKVKNTKLQSRKATKHTRHLGTYSKYVNYVKFLWIGYVGDGTGAGNVSSSRRSTSFGSVLLKEPNLLAPKRLLLVTTVPPHVFISLNKQLKTK
ncbi:hypothetical protein XENORESO_010838 [Xenotaenia resolanae]|uniref:Uncharacterized protein n=1 Tax=Xenotaenia resolanae TaxID=208358 RepID=A0ABV0W4Y8_9TELE